MKKIIKNILGGLCCLTLIGGLGLGFTYCVNPDMVKGWFGQAQEQPIDPIDPIPDVPDKPNPDIPDVPENPDDQSETKFVFVEEEFPFLTLDNNSLVFNTNNETIDISCGNGYLYEKTIYKETYSVTSKEDYLSIRENIKNKYISGETVSIEYAKSSEYGIFHTVIDGLSDNLCDIIRLCYSIECNDDELFPMNINIDGKKIVSIKMNEVNSKTNEIINSDVYMSSGDFFGHLTNGQADIYNIVFLSNYNLNFDNCPNLKTLIVDRFSANGYSMNNFNNTTIEKIIIQDVEEVAYWNYSEEEPFNVNMLNELKVQFYVQDELYLQYQSHELWSQIIDHVYVISELN